MRVRRVTGGPTRGLRPALRPPRLVVRTPRRRRYLVGDTITEADVRLFTTLARFDAVYHGHFKCNRSKLYRDAAALAYARPVPDARVRRHDRLRAHQAALPLRAHGHQPDPLVPKGPDLPGGSRRTTATSSAAARSATAPRPASRPPRSSSRPLRRPPLTRYVDDSSSRRSSTSFGAGSPSLHGSALSTPLVATPTPGARRTGRRPGVGPHPQRDQLLVTGQHLEALSRGPEHAVDVAHRQVVAGQLGRRAGGQQDQVGRRCPRRPATGSRCRRTGRSRISSTAGRNVSIGQLRRLQAGRDRAGPAPDRRRLTTSWCSGSTSVSVRPSHSSPGGGSTWRAIARRASDTTLANVASRTSRSHSAVRAPARVERVTVQRQPHDQLERLGPLEAHRRVRSGRRRRRGRARARAATTAGRRTVRRRLRRSGRVGPSTRHGRVASASTSGARPTRACRAASCSSSPSSPTGSEGQPERLQRPVTGVRPAATTARPAASPADDHRQPAAAGRAATAATRGVTSSATARTRRARSPAPTPRRWCAGPAGRTCSAGRRGRADQRGRQLQRLVDGCRRDGRWRWSRNASRRGRRRPGWPTRRRPTSPSVAAIPRTTVSACSSGGDDDSSPSASRSTSTSRPSSSTPSWASATHGSADGSGRVGEQLDRRRAGQRPARAAPVPRRRQRRRRRSASARPSPSVPARTTAIGAGRRRASRRPPGRRRRRAAAARRRRSARNRRSVATVSGGGSGTRARGRRARRRSRRRAATSASTPADSRAASPSPIGGRRRRSASAASASAGRPGVDGRRSTWSRGVVVAVVAAAAASAAAVGAGSDRRAGGDWDRAAAAVAAARPAAGRQLGRRWRCRRRADGGEVELLADIDQVRILDDVGVGVDHDLQVGGDGGVVGGQTGAGETLLGERPQVVAGSSTVDRPGRRRAALSSAAAAVPADTQAAR